MKLFKNFEIGFRAYGKAMNMLFTKQLWWFLLFPVLLNLVFFVAGMMGIGSLADYFENYLTRLVQFDGDEFVGASYLKPFAGYLTGFVGGLVWVVLKIVFFFVFATIGGYVVIICLAPVLAVLSEKTEKILTGNQYPFNADQIMRDVVRGVLVALRNMLIELGCIIVIFILGFFIPIIGGLIGSLLLFFIASYFYGFSFIDYTLERQRMSVKQSVEFMRQNKGLVIANGMVFSFFMLIPFCGVTLSGFAAILSVIAATIATHKVVDLTTNTKTRHKKKWLSEKESSKIEEKTGALDEGKED